MRSVRSDQNFISSNSDGSIRGWYLGMLTPIFLLTQLGSLHKMVAVSFIDSGHRK